MITEKIIHRNQLLSVVLYESSVEEDLEEYDYNDRPCLSFPLKAGFGYRTAGFDRFIDSNSFLVESQANEFSYTKYRDLGCDLTLCFIFANHQSFVQDFARFRAADVFRRTPQLSYVIHYLMRQCDGNRAQLDTIIDLILFDEIFQESLEKFSPSLDKRHSLPHIEAAKAYMHSQFASDISIDEIAEASYFSRFHFSRLFKNLTGTSPYQYLKQIRFFNARECLKKDISITEVALENGFNSLENFSAAFKNEYGISPQAYRVSQRKTYSTGDSF